MDRQPTLTINVDARAPIGGEPTDLIDAMDASGVQASVVSHSDVSAATSHAARAANEAAAALVQEFPSRFGACARLPLLASMDEAITELRYAREKLCLDGVALPTTVDGDFLGHARFQPLLSACEDADMPILLRPNAAPAPTTFEPAFLSPCFDLTRCIASLAYGGVRQRFPHLVVIAPDGGGVAPYLAGRFSAFAGSRNVGDLTEAEVWEGLSSLYFSFAPTARGASLAVLLNLCGVDRMLFGADLADVVRAREAIATVQRSSKLRTQDQIALLRRNALTVFPRLAERLRAVDPKPAPEPTQ